MTNERRDRDRVEAAIRRVRRRWRLRATLRGLSVVGAGALAAVLVTGFGLDLLRFSPGAVAAFRIGAYGLVLVLALRFLLPPLIRRISDAQVALYLEEHEPSLDAAVLTAVDGGPTVSEGLERRLAREAARRLRTVEDGDRVERRSLYRSTGVLVALTLAGLLVGLVGGGTLGTGASALLFPTRDAGELNPYAVEVLPGDTTVARGSDLLISARLVGFESGQVELMTAPAEGGAFEPVPMLATREGGFEFLLLEVGEARRYFVRSSGIRSPVFEVDVADLPYVDRMELVYHFPAYTGLEPRTVEDGGDVAVLPGTRVEFRAAPTVSTPDGRLVLDDSSTVELTPGADGRLEGELTVRAAGGYRVELRRPDGELGVASPHYRIDLLEDQPPAVRFEEPGRDTEATPIEEVFVEAAADDDYGIGALDLVYSVNGGAEDTLSLYRADGPPLPRVSAGHTFFLEEWELVPGDVVSYYAVARDNDRVAGPREVVSDIYFLGIRPFRKNFSAADSRPPSGGAGAAGAQGSLVEIQRQIVAATFNLVRDRERKDAEEWDDDVVSVALSQERLRGQVADLVARLQTRLSTAQEEAFRTVAEELPRALEAMDSAKAELDERRAREALAPEQRALLHLQRADEAYRDVRVSLQNAGGGAGGGGQTPRAEDLADLFELEMDKLRDQYETVQRGQRQQTDAELDETLERLKELARRQQQEAERRRRRLEAQGGGAAGGGAGDRQRSLAEETEEAARELERLARQRGAPELEETARRLRDAAEAMRRSAAGGGGSGTADAREAAERLEEARRRLEETRSGRFQEEVEDALERARRLRSDQEEVVDELRERAADGRPVDEETTRRLSERKDAMAGELESLEDQLDRAAARARGRGTEGAADLQEAATGIRDDKLKEKVRFSRGLVETGELERVLPFEEQIAGDLERLTERLEAAREAVAAAGEPDPLEDALERARRLGRSMETMDRRLRGSGEEGGGSDPQGEASGESRGQGRAGEGERNAPGQPAGGGRGRPSDGADARPGPGGPPSFGPEDARQLRREFRRRAEDAEALGRRLEDAGRDPSEVDRVVEALRALDDTRIYDDPEEVARLQEAALEGVRRLEFSLRRELEARDGPPLRLPGADEVPEAFRSLVEEYFRSLSEDVPGPGGA